MKKILLLAFFALSTTLTLFSQTVTSRKIFANPDCNCVTIVSVSDTNAVHDIDARAILSIRRVGASNVELTTQSGAVFVFNHINTFTKDSVRIATTSYGLQKAIRTIVKSLKVILAKSNASGYNATFDVSGLTANRTYALPDQDLTLGSGSGGSTWGSITGTLSSQTDLNNALAARVPLTGSSTLSGDFVPTTTNSSNLGSNANRFLGVYSNNLYASGKAFVGPITSSAYTGLTVDVGLTSFLGGTTTVNGALLPNVGGLNIGGISSEQHWSNVYVRSIVSELSTVSIQGGSAKIILEHAAGFNIPKLQLGYNNISTVTNLAKLGYATLISTNSNQYGWDVAPNINQTGTASYTVSRISPRIIASVGSNNKLFSVGTNDADYGTGNHTEVFGVDASGNTYTAGNALFGTNVSAGFRVDINGTVRATQYNIGAIPTNFIAGGGFGEIGIMNANVDLRVGGPPAIWTFADNAKDIGTSDRRWRYGYFGTGITVGGTSAPTHAVTLPTASTGIALHNQSDQTTNFEVGRLYWTSNKLRLSAEAAGTGQIRGLLFTSSLAEFQFAGSIWTTLGGTGINGIVNIGSGATTGLAGASRLGINPTFNASSGLQYLMSETPTINQTGGAGYVGYYASIYEQAVASGPKLLADWGVNSAANGGGTHTSRFSVTNTGKTTISDDIEITDKTKGIILFSPDNTRYRITVQNGGTLLVTAL